MEVQNNDGFQTGFPKTLSSKTANSRTKPITSAIDHNIKTYFFKAQTLSGKNRQKMVLNVFYEETNQDNMKLQTHWICIK